MRRLRLHSFHDGLNPPLGYFAATVGVAAAFGVTWLLQDYLQRTLMMVFWAAVFFASVLGGILPGLLASLLSVALVDLFLIPPVGALDLLAPQDIAPLVFFSLLSYTIALVTSRTVRERRRAEAAEAELTTQVALMHRQAMQLETHAEETQSLAAELAEANAHLEWLRAQADAANQAKSDFLARMSHDLRTPLNAIAGHAELIALGIHGPVTPAQADALARIASSQRYLLELISDILDFSKLEAGALRLEMGDVDVGEVIRQLESLVGPQFRSKGVAYEAELPREPVVVRGDRGRVLQICTNLLTNALKATPAGGRVELRCRAEDGHARLEVSDTGTGIPAERVADIFDPFTQVGRALNAPREGVGLGLAISRELARAMGGEISVESREGEGSRFVVSFPRPSR